MGRSALGRWIGGAFVCLVLGACSGTRDEFSFGDGGPPADDGSAPTSTGGTGSSGTPDEGCTVDADCADDPAGDHCDAQTGTCYPSCTPGDTRSCYSGPEQTQDRGACQSGTQTCGDNGRWLPFCEGEVLPSAEQCGNGADDDCDGLVDDTDADGDGFGICSGDCCDQDGANCSGAALVNPGAFEVQGNDVDDDCDGATDELPNLCDQGIASDTDDALDFARAMDLCETTQEDPAAPEERTWGVISASLTLADGTGTPLPVQHAVRPGFGSLIGPERGSNMVLLSSGHAAGSGDRDPDFAPFERGRDLGTSSPAPADWLAANGGSFPNVEGCAAASSDDANDPVMLTLRVRAPTNARSFSVMTQFFSAEYPEWVCSEFNDFFVALIDSASNDNPSDGNIAIFDDGNTVWPVGVNLVMIAEGLFTQCQNGQVGCARQNVRDYAGCVGNALLEGTGFDLSDDGCNGDQDQAGGGTGWLRMTGNVRPGEVFEIRFAVWDTSGHILDSLVILDDWVWSVEAAEPGVAPG